MGRPRHKERPLIVIEVESTLEHPFWRAVIDAAKKLEWMLLNIRASSYQIPFGMKPAGSIVTTLPDNWVVKKIKEHGCDLFVRYGAYQHKLDNEFPAVLPDRKAVGRLAAEHFSARGFKHVGDIVNVPRANQDDSHDAFRDRATELGLELHLLERPASTANPIYEDLTGWLPELPKPIGILTYSESLASKVYLAACESGLLVPQEVGILSMDDSYHCEICPVPISAIEMDRAAAGREAVNLLKRMLDGESPPPTTTIPPKRIVLRQSTDVMAVPDLVVAKALRYMWEHYDWPLTVDDIALEVNVSRSTLERRFKRHLGRSVKEELRRKRLEQCGGLLRTTSMSLDEVMSACGIGSRPYFHKIFLKAFGVTPANYRHMCSTDDIPAQGTPDDQA